MCKCRSVRSARKRPDGIPRRYHINDLRQPVGLRGILIRSTGTLVSRCLHDQTAQKRVVSPLWTLQFSARRSRISVLRDDRLIQDECKQVLHRKITVHDSDQTALPVPLDEPSVEAAGVVRQVWSRECRVAVILGSGLGSIVDSVQVESQIDYEEIPGFRRSTAIGHRGRLTCGLWNDTPVLLMEGRFHQYEGYTRQAVTLPVRVMRGLGIRSLIVTCAGGGLNPDYRTGDLVAIGECIDLTRFRRWSPASANGTPGEGQRFVRCSSDRELVQVARQSARTKNVRMDRGVYIAVTGPNYETRAEYRFLRSIGGDVVGMSTAPELAEAHRLGMQCLGLSVVTNCCQPSSLGPTTGEEVVGAASDAAGRMQSVLDALISHLHGQGPTAALSPEGTAGLR